MKLDFYSIKLQFVLIQFIIKHQKFIMCMGHTCGSPLSIFTTVIEFCNIHAIFILLVQ